MSTKPKVYIAGPYTAPTPEEVEAKVHNAIDTGSALVAEGFIPFVPHLYHFWHARQEHHYEVWMELDFAWLPACDALLRLPGTSPGADREVKLAVDLKIPVFHSITDLKVWRDRGIARSCPTCTSTVFVEDSRAP